MTYRNLEPPGIDDLEPFLLLEIVFLLLSCVDWLDTTLLNKESLNLCYKESSDLRGQVGGRLANGDTGRGDAGEA